jgi:hypothetical protein
MHYGLEPSKYSNWIAPQSWKILQFLLWVSMSSAESRKVSLFLDEYSCFAGFLWDCSNVQKSPGKTFINNK